MAWCALKAGVDHVAALVGQYFFAGVEQAWHHSSVFEGS
jgi:hypothetical protein